MVTSVMCSVPPQAHGEGPHQGLWGRKLGYHRSWARGTFLCDWVRPKWRLCTSTYDMCFCCFRVRKQSWSPSSSSWAKSSPSCLSSPASWPSRRGFVYSDFPHFALWISGIYLNSWFYCFRTLSRQRTASQTSQSWWQRRTWTSSLTSAGLRWGHTVSRDLNLWLPDLRWDS